MGKEVTIQWLIYDEAKSNSKLSLTSYQLRDSKKSCWMKSKAKFTVYKLSLNIVFPVTAEETKYNPWAMPRFSWNQQGCRLFG